MEEASIGMPASLTENPSFEQGNEDAPPWERWIKFSGEIERVEGISHTGNASLLLNNLERGGPTQTFAAQSGLLVTRVHYYTPPGTETKGSIQLIFNVKDAQGRNLSILQTEMASFSDSVGEWSSVGLLEEIPSTIGGRKVEQIQAVITIDGAEDAQVYVDDVVVYQYSLLE